MSSPTISTSVPDQMALFDDLIQELERPDDDPDADEPATDEGEDQ